MQQGKWSWGMRKHRVGGRGKNASSPSPKSKLRVQLDANKHLREEERKKAGRRALQDFVPAEEWVHRKK